MGARSPAVRPLKGRKERLSRLQHPRALLLPLLLPADAAAAVIPEDPHRGRREQPRRLNLADETNRHVAVGYDFGRPGRLGAPPPAAADSTFVASGGTPKGVFSSLAGARRPPVRGSLQLFGRSVVRVAARFRFSPIRRVRHVKADHGRRQRHRQKQPGYAAGCFRRRLRGRGRRPHADVEVGDCLGAKRRQEPVEQ